MAREDVILNFISRGARTVVRNLSDIRTQSVRASRSASALNRSLALIGGFFTIRQLQLYADTFTLLQNRLKLVTESTAELNLVTDQLFDISQRTFTRLEDTGTLYARLARNIKGVAITQGELLTITESVSKATALSSPSIQAAQAGLLQLAQGFGAAAFNGDELKSVLENIPRIGQVLTDFLGVSLQELRDLGAARKITQDIIIEAFREAKDEIEKEFKNFSPSISFALTRVENAFIRFIGRTDQAAGITRTLSTALTFLAENFDTVATAALTAASVLAVGALAGAIGQIGAAIIGVVKGLKFLAAVAASNPIGAIVVALGIATLAVVGFQDKIRPLANEIVTLGDVFKATFSVIKEEFNRIKPIFTEFGSDIARMWREVVDTTAFGVELLVTSFVKVINGIIGYWVGAFRVLGNVFDKGLDVLVSKVANWNNRIQNEFAGGVEDVLNSVVETLGITSFKVKLPKLSVDPDADATFERFAAQNRAIIEEAFGQDYLQDIFSSIFGAEGLSIEDFPFLDDILTRIRNRAAEIALSREAASQQAEDALGRTLSGSGKAGGAETGDLAGRATSEIIKELIRDNSILAQQLTLTTKAGEDFARAQEIINSQLDDGRTVTAAQAQQIRELVTQQREFKELQSEQSRLLDSLTESQDNYNLSMQALTNLLAHGLVTMEQYAKLLREIKLELLESSTKGIDGFERGILKLEDSLTNFAATAENFVTSTFNSMEDAFVEFTQTGKLSFKDLVNSIIADLTRIAFRDTIAQFFGLGGASFGGGGGALEGIFSGLGGLLGFKDGGSFEVNANTAVGGASAASVHKALPGFKDGGSFTVDSKAAPTINALAKTLPGFKDGGTFTVGANSPEPTLSSLTKTLPGFAQGGSFDVNAGSSLGTISGIDNRLIAFRARDGETVTVTPPGEKAQGGAVNNFNFNINTPDADSFGRSQSQLMARAAAAASRASSRNR